MSALKPRQFASDNYAGICPEAWAAMEEANHGHEAGYGEDIWTTRAADAIRGVFETDCDVFFVFNGTSANSLSLASLCQSYHSLLCHEIAHVEVSECGAPEFFANGTKVLLLPGADGKIDPRGIQNAVRRRDDIHYPKPRAVSVTQATEMGTIYSLEELGVIRKEARRYDLRIHMDGARFANAVAALNVPPKAISWQAGVDVLSFGGTRTGSRWAKRWFSSITSWPTSRVSLQARGTARLQDAVPIRALGRHVAGRRMAATRGARERHGTASRGPNSRSAKD